MKNNKKETVAVNLTPEQLRAELIAKGLLKARNESSVESATCVYCKAPFERLKGRSWETFCGARHH